MTLREATERYDMKLVDSVTHGVIYLYNGETLPERKPRHVRWRRDARTLQNMLLEEDVQAVLAEALVEETQYEEYKRARDRVLNGTAL